MSYIYSVQQCWPILSMRRRANPTTWRASPARGRCDVRPSRGVKRASRGRATTRQSRWRVRNPLAPGAAVAVQLANVTNGTVAFNTPPRRFGVDGAETASEVQEQSRGQPVREHVGELSRAGDVQHPDLAESNLVANEIYIQLNMFGALVMHRVPAHVNGRDVLAEDHRRGRRRAPELTEERAQPRTFCDGVGHAAVLSFDA